MSVKNLTWQHLIGFETEQSSLNTITQEKKLASVILFHGPEGIGKNIFVTRLCAQLLCIDRSACGVCSSCSHILNDSHPNLLTLDANFQQVSAKEIKNIKDHLSTFTSESGSKRILFIKDAEALTEQSMNKLLKVFEEISENCHIFLSSSRRFSLLPTIRSRCVEQLLSPPKLEQSMSFLVNKYPNIPGVDFSPPSSKELQELLDFSRGSIGLVIQWLNDKLSSYELMKEILNHGHSNDYEKTHKFIDKAKRSNSHTLEKIVQATELALNKQLKEASQKSEDKQTLQLLFKKEKL